MSLAALASTFRELFAPPVHTLRQYSLHKFRKDLVAGLTVSVVELPQAMAYALIAGVPPQYGLYTSIIQGMVGALLSSSEHMTTGPTNTQSLLIASAAGRMTGDPVVYLNVVFALAMLKGLIQLGLFAARMGNLVRYVSRSVIVGVAAGAGILIIVGQLPSFLGVAPLPRAPGQWPGVLGSLQRLAPVLHGINLRAVGIGVGCLAVILGLRALSRFAPGSLVAVILSAIVVAASGWDESTLPLIGRIPPSLPSFHVPRVSLDQLESLFGGALALALLGILESVAIAKSIAAHTGERISANQEFFAQGLKNFLTSFFQCMPGSGSFTRSALDWAAGAETRFAAVMNALFVAVMFLLLGNQARHIPLSALAAVLFVIAVGLMDWRYIWRIARTDRSEAAVCIATLIATALAPLEYAIFIGIFLSLGMYLRRASHLHLVEMYQAPGGPFIERPLHDRSGARRVIFLQIEGDLFFAVADELQDELSRLARSDVRVVILRLKRMHSIDATVLEVLERFTKQMHERGGHVILCGLRQPAMDTLRRFGLVDLIGRDNLFATGFGVFDSAKRAIRRAREILGSSIDAEGIPADDEPDGPAYQI